MHNPFFRVIMSLMAVGVTSATQSISLSNFTPRIENLPASCQSAYTSPIEGCQASDFTTADRCSAQCVQGLIKISNLVAQQCGNVDVPETSIIGVFLLGKGVPSLCPGVEVTTVGQSSTQAPPPQTSAQAQTSSAAQPPASSQAQASSSAAASSSSAESAPAQSSAANTPNQSAAPPSSTSVPQITFDTGNAPPAPAQTADSQKSNKDSGGGSPFDVQATGASSQLQLGNYAILAMLGIAAFFTAFL